MRNSIIKNIKKILFISLFLGIFYVLNFKFYIPKASAQSFSLGIYPPIIQINANPPISIKAPLQVKNFSNQTLKLNIQIKPFAPSTKNNGDIDILWNTPITGADNNITNNFEILDEQGNHITQITLAPKQTKKMFLHISLPPNEPPSDYYFTLIFISNSISNNQNTSTALQGGIGVNVLLSIGPTSKIPQGSLEKFFAPLIIGDGPVSIKILVNNPNSFFITPHGNLVIYNMFDQIVGKINLLPVNILENSQRYIPDNKSGYLDKAVWNEKALFGIYRIKLSLLLTPNGPLFEKNIYFIALPINIILGIIIFCFLLAITILGIREKLKKNKINMSF